MYFQVPTSADPIRVLAHACAGENITSAALSFLLCYASMLLKVKCIPKYLLVLTGLEC